MNFDKVVIADRSNNAGVWGGVSSHRRQTEVRGPSPWRCGDFSVFFQKIRILSILRSKFLLKTHFKKTTKSVLVRPQGLHPGARAPTCYATDLLVLERSRTVFHFCIPCTKTFSAFFEIKFLLNKAYNLSCFVYQKSAEFDLAKRAHDDKSEQYIIRYQHAVNLKTIKTFE